MTNTEKNDLNATIGNTVLCDGFLIPMTDFVLEQLNEQNSRTKPMREVFNSLEKYAKFLKQPLKLEMFVPWDDDGNVLAEPKKPHTFASENSDEYIKKWKSEIEIYNKAKEKVLFEGFKLYKDYECAKYEDVYVDEEVCDGKFTIEELIKDIGETKIKLSQTALNAIFGKTVA